MSEYNVQESQREEEIDLLALLGDIWRGICRFWWLIIVVCAVTAAGTYAVNVIRYTPVYESRASFSVVTQTSYQELDTSYSYSFHYSTADHLSLVFPHLITSNVLSDMVCTELDVPKMEGRLSIEAIGESNLFVMKLTALEPKKAKDILEATLKYFPEICRYVIGETRLNIIEPPTFPEKPSNELNLRKTVVMGLAVGLALCLLVLAIFALFRKTVHSEEDFKTRLHLQCFGVIPKVKFRSSRKKMDTTVHMNNKKISVGYTEAIRSSVMKLDRTLAASGGRVVVVTSTMPGEGKSTVSRSTAQSLAKMGKTVLFIDADMRKPSIYQAIGLSDSKPQLSDVLKGSAVWQDAVYQCRKDGFSYIGNRLSADKPLKLLSSKHMKDIIAAAKKEYDYIIIDTPPCGNLADASVLAEQADGILFVVRQDMAEQTQIMDALYTLSVHKHAAIGGVLNGAESSFGGYGYGYRYGGYYGRYGYGYGKRSRKQMRDEE